MTKLVTSSGLVLTALQLSACTTTLSSSLAPATGRPSGFSYQLPSTSYELSTTRILSECPGPGEDLTLEAAATGVGKLVPGPAVFVQYEALGNASKTTDATFSKHPNQMLKSFNVTVQDHTGDIIKSAVKAAVGVGKLAMGIAAPITGVSDDKSEGPKVAVVCSTIGESRVAAYKAQTKNVKAATKTLTEATEALAGYDADHALDAPRSEVTNTEHARLAKLVRDARTALDEVTKGYAEAKGKLTLTHTITFTPTLNEARLDPVTATADGAFIAENLRVGFYAPPVNQVRPPPTFAAIGADLQIVRATAAPAPVSDNAAESMQDAVTKAVGRMGVSIAATRLDPGATASLTTASPCGSDPKKQGACGIIYRTASMGRIQVCQTVTVTDCANALEKAPGVLLRDDRNIAQFGQEVSLSLHNGAWSHNTLSASFFEDGTIETATYKKVSAEAVGALDSLNDVVSGATELAIYNANGPLRQAQRQQARDVSSLNALNASTNLQTAQQLQALQLQKSLGDANAAYELGKLTQALATQQTLEQMAALTRTSTDAATTSDLEQVQTDTTLLNALKAKLEAQQALAAVVAKAPGT